VLTQQVIEHAQERSSKPLDASELRKAARRVGAPVAAPAPDRAALRSSLASSGFEERSCACSMTCCVSTLNVASVRLRGPAAVACDSRISQVPVLRGTT
jgi:hypothetical protein